MRKFVLIISGSMIGMSVLLANSALYFNGSDEYVQLSEVLPIGSSSNTVEMWVKVPEVGSGNLEAEERVGILLGNFDNNPNLNYEIHSAGEIRLYWNGGHPDIRGTRDLRDNTWHHLAFIRDKGNGKFLAYVDGNLELEYVESGADLTFTTTHRIGRDNRASGSPHFHGEIDDIRIWNTARTQAQIREFMCEDVRAESGLVAYYRMSDGSGTSLSDDKGTNSGTLVNMDNSNWQTDHLIPAGDGSTTPYQIKSLNHLYWVSQTTGTWSSDFEQIADIDASPTPDWNAGAGFSPIGTNSNRFSGSYAGNGYTIESLTIHRPSTNYCGMFGQVNNNGQISDLHLSSASITGQQSTGALAGYLESGNVNGCSVSGTVGGTDYVGGLVGQIANGEISQSFSNASVSGSGIEAGGLVGLMAGVVSNCYASGTVSGGTRVGGLIGGAFGGSTTTNSYSTGGISGSSEVGGLIGYADPGYESSIPGEEMPAASVTACFWDTESSGQSGSDAGSGKTTSEMKDYTTFTTAGWDFKGESVNGTDDIWNIGNGRNDGYPYLNCQYPGDDTPLPVTLAYFKAEAKQGRVMLSWRTESETENAGFVLEKKSSGENWAVLDDYLQNPALTGQGSTSEPYDYLFTDEQVIPGINTFYRLSDVDYAGTVSIQTELEVTAKVESEHISHQFGLLRAYPNPFNPSVQLEYKISEKAHTSLQIYDLHGRRVAELLNTEQDTGTYILSWQPGEIPGGVYIARLRATDQTSMRKILYLK